MTVTFDRARLAWGNLRPGEMLGLWDMIELNAPKLHHLLAWLFTLEGALTARLPGERAIVLTGNSKPNTDTEYDMHISILRDLGMDSCATALLRIKTCQKSIGQGANTTERLVRLLSDFRDRLYDDLQHPYFIVLQPRERGLFEPKEPLFGPDVFDKFPDARDDVDEAGKCLALSRNKATVCHLMLAMEIALRALANKIGATVQDGNGKWLPWLTIANNIEPKIKAMPEGDEKVAWWEVHSMLSSVGRAWRNPTMHPARSYDDAQARKVLEAVKGFMQDLALRL